jgi:HEAT repeat protein
VPFDFGLGERFLLFLGIGIGLLFLLAIGFACSVMLLRVKNERRAVTWQRLEAKWEKAILAVLSGEMEAASFAALVAPDERLFCVNYIQRYARRLQGPERERLKQLAAPYLTLVFDRVRSDDARRRARAVQTLGELGLPDHADTIVDALADPSPLVAMVAAHALVREAHPDYVAPILDQLHRFTTWSPNFLASMLSRVGLEAASPLRAVLADGARAPDVRVIAATALGYLHDPPSAAIAAAVLKSDTDTELTAAVLRLIARVGQQEHREIVRPFLGSPDFVVRAAAASALGSVGDERDRETLRHACDDPSRWVAIHAARALRDAGDLSSLRTLAGSGKARATLAMQILSEVEG